VAVRMGTEVYRVEARKAACLSSTPSKRGYLVLNAEFSFIELLNRIGRFFIMAKKKGEAKVEKLKEKMKEKKADKKK